MTHSTGGWPAGILMLSRLRWVLPAVIWLIPLHCQCWRPAEVYLWAAREIRSGEFGPHAYDDAAVSQEIGRITRGQVRDILSPTPPTMPLFILPLTFLSPPWLGLSWGLGILLALLSAALLVLGALRYSRSKLPLAGMAAAALLVSAPMQLNIARGQVYHWLLLFFAAGLYGLATADRRGRTANGVAVGGPAWDWLAGLSLALAVLWKLAGWPVWLVLAVRGRWRVLGQAGAITAVVVLLSLPWIGLDTWWRFAHDVVPGWLGSPTVMIPAYQTFNGLIQHLFRYDAQWNPAPLVDAPALGVLFSALGTIGLVSATVLLARRTPLLQAVGAGLLLTILLAPVAEQHHYLIAFIPFLVAVECWSRRPERWTALLLVASAMLLFAPLPYNNPALWKGWKAVLAYPRVWGGLLLWIILFSLVRKRTARTTSGNGVA